MLEFNHIYNMDCVEGLKQLPNDCIDLTVTSPPYDNLRTYHGYTFDFPSIAQELFRVTKPGGVVVWVVADATVKAVRPARPSGRRWDSSKPASICTTP